MPTCLSTQPFVSAIPLVNTSIHSLLRDIVTLDEKSETNLLTFKLFNGKPCTLVHPVCSASYKLFKQNIHRTKWMDALLSAICDDKDVAAEWIIHFLGKRYEHKLTEVAIHLGLLLPSNVMDAETPCAMWEEANCPYKAQRVILRHLKNFFGRRITVPERFIRWLEDGVLNPRSDQKVIDGKTVYFWHKNIDEVVAHQLKLELKHRGPDFGTQYNALDVVFGGDHGARCFRAVVQLIFRSKNNPEVPTCSVTLQVGHFDAAKDTYEVLENTIAKQLNEGLRRIVNKFAVVYSVEHNEPTVIFADEMPVADINNNDTHNKCVFFEVRAFVSGDLAFYSTILGKPNMSLCWCNWCMLFKQAWNLE